MFSIWIIITVLIQPEFYSNIAGGNPDNYPLIITHSENPNTQLIYSQEVKENFDYGDILDTISPSYKIGNAFSSEEKCNETLSEMFNDYPEGTYHSRITQNGQLQFVRLKVLDVSQCIKIDANDILPIALEKKMLFKELMKYKRAGHEESERAKYIEKVLHGKHFVKEWYETKGLDIDKNEDDLWEFYHKNGEVESIGPIKNGEKHGPWKVFFDNGELQKQGNFEFGVESGLWTYYFENGQLKARESYQNGTKNGPAEYYYSNGQLDAKVYYKYGKLEGSFTLYDENGQIKGKVNFKDGKRID